MIRNIGETYFRTFYVCAQQLSEFLITFVIMILFTMVLPFLLIIGLIHLISEGKDEI